MTNQVFSSNMATNQPQGIDNSGMEEIEYPRMYGEKSTCEDCGYADLEDDMPECPQCHVKLLWFPPEGK